jgi:hypothetical protein
MGTYPIHQINLHIGGKLVNTIILRPIGALKNYLNQEGPFNHLITNFFVQIRI